MSLLKKLSFTELIAFSEAVAKESCAMNVVGLPWDMRRRVVTFLLAGEDNWVVIRMQCCTVEDGFVQPRSIPNELAKHLFSPKFTECAQNAPCNELSKIAKLCLLSRQVWRNRTTSPFLFLTFFIPGCALSFSSSLCALILSLFVPGLFGSINFCFCSLLCMLGLFVLVSTFGVDFVLFLVFVDWVRSGAYLLFVETALLLCSSSSLLLVGTRQKHLVLGHNLQNLGLFIRIISGRCIFASWQ
ncbi:uncharacterized protein LOC133867234 [Alnus glutinosa]|uniref:uncharacterized protein LOC133867234 n=1 Tax=Alnus glutinosa TaxID=3517 RepID=UPI002D78D6FC|nr:uncharacterized protein LOC133867234 [Alnus glutinosa]